MPYLGWLVSVPAVKYHKAKKSVKNYYEELTQLSKIYGREDKKSSTRGVTGGYKK